MLLEDKEEFIGTKLKAIPHSTLLYANHTQILLNSKRQVIKLDTLSQTLVYSNIDDEKIIFTTYHTALELYLILTEKNILAVNSEGQLIKKIDNQVLFGAKFVFLAAFSDGYYGVPNERQDFLIFVKGDHLYTAKIKVYYERQLIKNKGICDVSIQYDSSALHESPQLIEYAKHLVKQNILILWNSFECYVYSIPKNRDDSFERLYIYNKISRRQNLALDYAISYYYKIMMISYQSGVIKIYNFDFTKKYMYELKGHQNDCFTIFVPENNEHFLYSAAMDSTVRIWNLRDYQEVYSLQLDVLINQAHFITQKMIFVNSNELKEKSYLCQLNTNLLDPIVNENKSGHLIKMKCNRQWSMSIYQNNYVQFFIISGSGTSKKYQKIEYPEKYGLIRDIFEIDLNNYMIAVEKGFSLVKFNKDIITSQNFQLKKLVYNESIVKINQDDRFIELIHEKLLGTYIFNVVSDWKNIPLSIKVTSVYYHQNRYLPKWDNTNQQQVQPKPNNAIFCILGTSKGQIFFVDIQKKNNYYTKVKFHTCDILTIRQIKPTKTTLSMKNPQSNDLYFLSISSNKQITIWKLSHQKPPNDLINIRFNREFTFIEVYQDYLVLGQKTGEFSIIKIHIQNDQVIMRKSTNVVGHLRAVISGDYMHYQGFDLFLSGGQDSVIKIWKGLEKELLYQLKLFGIISTVNFIHNKLSLIVCHNEQISFLRVEKLKNLNRVDQRLKDMSKQVISKSDDGQDQKEENNGYKQHVESIQTIDIKDYFYFLKEISPLSPKKSYLQSKFKNRPFPTTINYLNEDSNDEMKNRISLPVHQMVRGIYLMPIPKSQRYMPKVESNVIKSRVQTLFQPTQMKNVVSSDQMPKSKRFHIHSSNFDPSQFELPRLNIKRPMPYHHKKKKFSQRLNDQVLSQLRSVKEKTFSNAGRIQQKR